MSAVARSLLLACAALSVSCVITAADAPHVEYALDDPVPLSAADLQAITLQVMQRHPLLASSPGVKFAAAQRSVQSADIATIIYLPHTQSAGIKEAFQVRCVRRALDKPWNCDEIELRRYLQLATQQFEVRVTAARIRTEEALALIQAARNTVQASATDPSAVPRTAILIARLTDPDGYLVTWGNPQGHEALTVTGRLRPGGNPENAEDWQTALVEPDE